MLHITNCAFRDAIRTLAIVAAVVAVSQAFSVHHQRQQPASASVGLPRASRYLRHHLLQHHSMDEDDVINPVSIEESSRSRSQEEEMSSEEEDEEVGSSSSSLGDGALVGLLPPILPHPSLTGNQLQLLRYAVLKEALGTDVKVKAKGPSRKRTMRKRGQCWDLKDVCCLWNICW